MQIKKIVRQAAVEAAAPTNSKSHCKQLVEDN